jgi:hypothetical protein
MTIEPQLHFHTSVCKTHQQDFVAICLEEGVRDRLLMERVRMRLIVAAMHHFAADEFVAFIRSQCVGCAHAEWAEAIARRLAQEEKRVSA